MINLRHAHIIGVTSNFIYNGDEVVIVYESIEITDLHSCYEVLVALNSSISSYRALGCAVDLCLKISTNYKLVIFYVVALNPSQNLPYL